jgi:hypothetical protein
MLIDLNGSIGQTAETRNNVLILVVQHPGNMRWRSEEMITTDN